MTQRTNILPNFQNLKPQAALPKGRKDGMIGAKSIKKRGTSKRKKS